jgi:hypothetical protein
MPNETLTDWRDRTTITVPEAGEVLGLSRNSAYNAANTGQLPVITLGHRLVVPVARLRRMLGELEEVTPALEAG